VQKLPVDNQQLPTKAAERPSGFDDEKPRDRNGSAPMQFPM